MSSEFKSSLQSPLDHKGDVDHSEYSPVAEQVGQAIDDTAVGDYVNKDVVIDDATNRRLRRMMDTRVLPLLALAYFCQALDKSTTGTASIMGLQADTHMVGQDYALTSTVLWIGIVVGEFPANRLIQVAPMGKTLGIAMICWGLLLVGQAFLKQPGPYFALRFLLGLFESTIGPILFRFMVHKKDEQPLITAIWQGTYGISVAVSSLLGYAFLHVNTTSLAGWRIMFLGVSGFSILAGLVVLILMPDAPTKARWASEEDKVLLVERVRTNDQGLVNPTWKWDQAREGFTDVYCWCLVFFAIWNTLVVGGINTFSGLLINKAFGFNAAESQLLSIPLGFMSIVAYMTGALLTRKYNQTSWVMIGLVVPNVIGTICLITIAPSSSTKGGLVVVFYIMQFFQAANPLIFASMSRNIAGSSKKTVVYAMTFIGWAVGNAIASQLFQSKWAPRYTPSLYIHLGLYACFVINVLFARALLVRRNKQKIEAQAGQEESDHVHAFQDLTDRMNPDFRYSL